MDIVFDEISQFIVKKIVNKQKNEFEKYFDLTKNKKYIVCYYDKSNKLIICQYCGRFDNIDIDHGGAYGDIGEGYHFDIGIKDYRFCTTISNCYKPLPGYECKIFFELEENFNFDTMKNIYTFVIENLKHGSMNYNDIKLISSTEYVDNNDIICDMEYEHSL